jgi:hypothetical protein
MIRRASNSPSGSWVSFRFDYFEYLFSPSLQVENTPLKSGEAMRSINLKMKSEMLLDFPSESLFFYRLRALRLFRIFGVTL